MEPHSNSPQGLHLPQPLTGDGSVTQYSAASDSPQIVDTPQPPISMPLAQSNDQSDDLDKEWIAKAKMIVEQTKHDPYLQSRELGKVKADYLRIRFNKHIKISPDKTI